jgi:hypothetical protein
MTGDCPACDPGRPLVPLSLGASGPTIVWRCMRCHGAWVLLGNVAFVRAHFGSDHPILDDRLLRPHCRVCRAGFARGQTWCDDKHDQGIECVSCGQTMEIVRLKEVIIDVCLHCRAAWFDEGELGATVRSHNGEIRARSSSAGAANGVSLGILDVAEAANAVVALPEAAAAAGEAAVGAVEGVFSVLGSVLDLFSGFDIDF